MSEHSYTHTFTYVCVRTLSPIDGHWPAASVAVSVAAAVRIESQLEESVAKREGERQSVQARAKLDKEPFALHLTVGEFAFVLHLLLFYFYFFFIYWFSFFALHSLAVGKERWQ